MSRAGVPQRTRRARHGPRSARRRRESTTVHAYLDEKAAALAKLAGLIERILHPDPARVVNLR